MPDGRRALLVAATRAFANAGFDGADLRGIAAAAGVSPNLVRVHFGSKAGLWDACLDAIVDAAGPTMAEVMAIAGDGRKALAERLREVVARVTAFYASHPEHRDFVVRHATDTPDRASRVTDRLLRPAYETCRDVFAAGIEAGLIRSRHPALFFALLNSAANQPANCPALLHRLAPEIAPETVHGLMAETIVATLIHESVLSPPP